MVIDDLVEEGDYGREDATHLAHPVQIGGVSWRTCYSVLELSVEHSQVRYLERWSSYWIVSWGQSTTKCRADGVQMRSG
jgi:hypothetical protein